MTTTVIAVSHHGDSKLALASDLARELILRGQTEVGIERHWLRGPHLRLWLDGRTGNASEVEGIAREVLARHASRTVLDPKLYVLTSEQIGRTELVAGPYGPLRPDNIVEHDTLAVAAVARIIGHQTLELKRCVMAAFAPAVAASADLARFPGPVRLIGPILALTAHWEVAGVRSGYLTFRSHLEDYLNLHDKDGRLRAGFSQMFRAARPSLEPLVHQIIDEVESDNDLRRGFYLGPDPALRAWSTAVAVALAHTRAAAELGLITEDLGDGYLSVARRDFTDDVARWTFDEHRSYSKFHEQLRGLNHLPVRVNVVPFAAYRFVVNQFIRSTTLLDTSPVERYFACYAVSELVESYFGTSWQELLDSGRRGIA